jgi:hypothetical protein
MSQGRYVSGELVRSVYVVNMSSGGGSGTPGGSDTQIQFNNAGVFGGVANSSVNNATGNITLGSRVSVPLGTAALPSIYPGTDTNTGIYSPGVGQLAVATNGTGRLFIDANGFVGIGAVNTGSTGAQLSTTTTNSTARLIVESTNAAGYTGLRVANGTGHWEMQVDGANQGLRWLDDGSERLRITSAGLVGIGTSAPDVVLDVRTGAAGFGQFVHASGLGGVRIAGTGQFSASSLVFANNHSAGVVDGYTIQLDGANQSLKFLSGGTAATARMTLLSDGKVGIGTTSPVQALDVVGSINLTGNHTFSTTTSPLIAATAASSVLRFGTGSGGTERARIDSSGRLLVGTSSARTTLFNTAIAPPIQVEGTGLGDRFLAAISSSSTGSRGGGVVVAHQKSGTLNGNTALAEQDSAGLVSFQGNDATNFIEAARIEVFVDGTPGTNDMPGRLVFSTTADGASSPTERLHINSVGQTMVNSAGTAAAPVISKVDDTNTGIFFPAADTIAFAEGGVERARIDSSGRLLVGTSTSTSVGGSAATVQILGTGGNPHSLQLTRGDAPVLVFGKTDVGGGANCLGAVVFAGNDTNDLNSVGATIGAFVDGTIGVNDLPTRLVFSTTSDSASSPTERMRITSDAYVRLAAGTGGIQFNGDTAAANALDDYEEGTWTPVITTDGGGATSNITTTGTYRKIGNVITCYVTINFGASSTIGVSTTFRMSLPFAASVGGSMAISQTSTVGILTSGYISGTMRATRASDGGSAQAYRGSFSYI